MIWIEIDFCTLDAQSSFCTCLAAKVKISALEKGCQ